jgi:endonuclease G
MFSRLSYRLFASLVFAWSFSSPVFAAASNCPESYYRGQRPDAANPRLAASARELCSAGYAVWYSGIARTPLWAGEFLTKGGIDAGREVARSNHFRADTRLAADWRSTLEDFKGSGFDRGHLAPSADMATPAADSQSFILSNMVPQDPTLNRYLWAAIEKAVRAQANYAPVYVITGALFLDASVRRINDRVMVPSHLYKIVYDPRTNAAAAYVVENAANKRHREMSLADIEKLAGIRFLPGAENVKMLKLPRPRY